MGNREYKLVKIGKANNIQKRKEAIQVGFPYLLDVLLVIEGNESVERTLHLKFKDKRMRGEWFELDDEIEAFILDPNVTPNKLYNDALDKGIKYSEQIDLKIEELYKSKLSNIEISKQMDINISKVRKVIKEKKLIQHRIIKNPKPKGHYTILNIRRKAYKDFRNKLITKEQLDNILIQYPPDKRGSKKPMI